MSDLSRAVWRKSKRSGVGGCVEVAFLDGHQVAVRDSKDPHGSVLVFSSAVWKEFLVALRRGQFEAPI